jgi:hypothetical protein
MSNNVFIRAPYWRGILYIRIYIYIYIYTQYKILTATNLSVTTAENMRF